MITQEIIFDRSERSVILDELRSRNDEVNEWG